jgi:hypothetical protein
MVYMLLLLLQVCQPSDSAPGSCTYPDCLYKEQKFLTDRWALGKCTLLQVDDAANPGLVQGEEGAITLALVQEVVTIVLPPQSSLFNTRQC